jgi:hypothetical protein
VRGQVKTYISTSLYNKLLDEKKKLKTIENKKVNSRRIRITLTVASRSLARKL